MRSDLVKFGCVLLSLFSNNLLGQEVDMVKIPDVMKRIGIVDDSVLVLNFWATWCQPCVQELPDFIRMEKDLKNQKVKFIYLSLDFKKDRNTRLKEFIINKKIDSEIFLLDEPDYNSWIDIIHPSWQGSIPATLIVNRKNQEQIFHEGILSYEELKDLIKNYILWKN